MLEPNQKEWRPSRERLRHLIFDHNTPASKAFDIVLLLIILCSLIVVMLDTVEPIRSVKKYHNLLFGLEWFFTIIFTIEYITRLYVSRKPLRYARSFFGIVDLLSCLPAYLALIGGTGPYTGVVRTLRLLRVFRVLKMMRFIGEADYLMRALRAARPKITVFVSGVIILVVLLGTLMYVIESTLDPNSDFSSIPEGVYWAIVTLTTVGFGDVTPETAFGKMVASAVMLLGYAIIAVPTGIVGAEIARATIRTPHASGRSCPECGVDGHSDTAKFCRMCGAELEGEPPLEEAANEEVATPKPPASAKAKTPKRKAAKAKTPKRKSPTAKESKAKTAKRKASKSKTANAKTAKRKTPKAKS